MRTFLICLLAIGAFAAESAKKESTQKHVKRGSLTSDQGSNVYSDDYGQQVLRYVQQPAYKHVLQTVPVSPHTSNLAYNAASLPLEFYQRTYSAEVHDNVAGQPLVQQVARAYYDQSARLQGQSVGQEVYDYGSSPSTGHQTGGTRVVSSAVNTPVSVHHLVPVTRTLEVPVLHPVPVEVRRPINVPLSSPAPVNVVRTYQVNVDRPESVLRSFDVPQHVPVAVGFPHQVPVQVSHQQPLNIATGHGDSVGHQQNFVASDGVSYEQQGLVGQRINFYENSGNLGDLATADKVGGYEQVNVGRQQFTFGGQETFPDVESALRSAYKTATYTQHVEEPARVITSKSDNDNSGYHYDKPTKVFTF